MPTIHNPNLRGESSEAHLIGSILLSLLLVLLLAVGYRILTHSLMHANLGDLIRAKYATIQRTAIPAQSPSDHFGWLGFLAKPLYLALHFTYMHSLHNWGWTIVVLTLGFNLLLLWPRLISMRSAMRTAGLQPKLDAARKRYAHLRFDDPRRAAINTEIVTLYKAEGGSIYGGCLPMALQVPLFLAFLRILEGAAELHHATWLWISDLAAPDPLHLLPALVILCMALAQLIAPTPGIQPAQRRFLVLASPLVMGFTLWHCASGLALYWLTGALFSLVLQLCFNAAVRSRRQFPTAAA